jgi:hypothetical protein
MSNIKSLVQQKYKNPIILRWNLLSCRISIKKYLHCHKIIKMLKHDNINITHFKVMREGKIKKIVKQIMHTGQKL